MDAINKLTISCFNVRGIMSSCKYIESLLESYDIDILGISEHWLFPHSLSFLNNISSMYEGLGVCCNDLDPATSHHRGKGGVAFLYKKSLKHTLNSIEVEDDRIQGISITVGDGRFLKIFNVYLPSSNYSNILYEEYIDKLYEVYCANSESECIFMGDFNCEIQGQRCKKATPVRSELLCHLLDNLNYVSLSVNEACGGPEYTYDPTGSHNVTSHIDHFLVSKILESVVTKSSIIEEAENPSDHLPIMVNVSVGVGNACSLAKRVERKRLKWDKFNQSQIKVLYTEPLTELLEKVKRPDSMICSRETIEKYYLDLVKCMNEIAKKGIPEKKYVSGLKPFWTENVKNAHGYMRAKRSTWLCEGKPRNVENASLRAYKEAKRVFQKVFRSAKHNWEYEEYQKIENSAEINQKQFWSLVNSRRKKKGNKQFAIKFNDKMCTTTDEILQGWEMYFTKLYSPLDNENFDSKFKEDIENRFVKCQRENQNIDCYLDSIIEPCEVELACRSLKLNSAGGMDMLTNEHLIYGGQSLYSHLSYLFSCMLMNSTTPADMKIGLLITLLKPGKKAKANPDCYRGITLLPVVYKLYEKVTLERMVCHFKSLTPPRPDPLQVAYQKGLSSINTSFSLIETIKYNQERGSKVFVCCLDNMKAFDIVWHKGLFVCLYELGVKGHMWNSIVESYTDMYNIVFHNGCISNHISVQQSTRQGSFWGGWFYLMLINPLITRLRELGLGACIHDLFTSAFVQADDIALVALSKQSMQIMIQECYNFACKWRFLIHPDKTKILVYGENKKAGNQRKCTLGDQPISEVKSHVHCGITLSTEKSNTFHIKDVCKKGRGLMVQLLHSGLGNLNPITWCKLLKAIIYPSVLYGCELWPRLSTTEEAMLERLQRYCAKLIQKLGRQARSDICCPMLGLGTLKSHIDKIKLNFFRRLLSLSNNTVSKQIFLRRWFQHSIEDRDKSNFCSDIKCVLREYDLLNYAENTIFGNLYIPDKTVWKAICKSAINNVEQSNYDSRTGTDEFERFISIHPDIFEFSWLWHLCKAYPQKLQKCFVIASYIAQPSKDVILCEFCGRLIYDQLEHFATVCDKTLCARENFWSKVTNIFPVQFSAYLNNLDEKSLLDTMLGAQLGCYISEEQYTIFLLMCIDLMFDLLLLKA
jgi:exonuclease III